MAVITPNTDLYLLKVPLEIDDINQLDFSNATAQYNYFNSLPKISVDDFTYQRKDNTIRFPAQYDEIITYNYCMYRNTEYSNKWFYAFITNMEYVNDNMTMITIKSDVWQCWQFDLNYKPCLIDREHTNNDTVGSNTLPEGLELGEMVTNGSIVNFGDASSYSIVVEVSQIENTGESATLSYYWASGETPHNVTPILNDISRGTTPLIAEDVVDLEALRNTYDLAGLSESIVNIYMLPTSLIGTTHKINLEAVSGSTSSTAGPFGIPETKNGVFSMTSQTIDRPMTLGSFIPKNNKLLTFPFCYFNISNNAGSSLPFHYEDFSSAITFNVEGSFCPSGEVKAIPQNYKNITNSGNALDYSISGGKYPICSWKSDSYTNWLTQNAVNMQTEWRSTLISAGVDIFGGGVTAGTIPGMTLGAIAGAKEIISTAREQHLAKTSANLVPDQVHGNINVGDFVWAKYKSPFTYIPMCIKPEYARCIDEFFTQFGYKCNRVKLPNITGRRNWNYVKTVGCYIEADIPQGDLAEIKGMFDKGITIWHNPLYFGDYSQNNDII